MGRDCARATDHGQIRDAGGYWGLTEGEVVGVCGVRDQYGGGMAGAL
jgi:hypothetical protein